MRRRYLGLGIVLSLLLLSSRPVMANSSWVWLTKARPWHLLPLVIIMTIAIETVIIDYLGQIKDIRRTASIVILANILSFLIPYFFAMLVDSSVLEKFPFYTVNLGLIVLTLVLEVPIVFTSLYRRTKDKFRLLLASLFANIITSCLVALVERLIAYGKYFA